MVDLEPFEIAIGDCVTFKYKGKFCEGYCYSISRLSGQHKVYHFFMHVRWVHHLMRLDVPQCAENISDIQKVENLHFFTIQEFTDTMLSMRGEFHVLAFRDFGETNKLFFKNNNKYFKVMLSSTYKFNGAVGFVYVSTCSEEEYNEYVKQNKSNITMVSEDAETMPRAIENDDLRGIVSCHETIIKQFGGIVGVSFGVCYIFDYRRPREGSAISNGLVASRTCEDSDWYTKWGAR